MLFLDMMERPLYYAGIDDEDIAVAMTTEWLVPISTNM